MTRSRPDDSLPTGLPIRAGDRGKSVRDLQQRLVRVIGAPITDPPNVFGPATTRALEVFQERAGLEVDGICGKQTWTAITEAGYSLGDRSLYQRSPMLRGDDVSDLQLRLSALGFQSGRVDGIFGPDTAAAVISFQRNAGLVTDGVVGVAVLEHLLRLSGRTGTVTKASLREQLTLMDAPRHLVGQRVVIAESGTLPAVATALGRHLDEAGAHTLVVHHPDGSAQAAEANRFDAHVFIGLGSRVAEGTRLAYYRTSGLESIGGRRLAEFAADALHTIDIPGAIDVHGMRIDVLRETRMPALSCDVGPIGWLVEHAADLAEALAGAVARWTVDPVEDPEP